MSLQTPLNQLWRLPENLNMHRTAPSSRQRARPHVPENHNNNMVIVPHPPYSPDFALCDFRFVPQIENETEGTTF
jgi:hypothetical protein